MTKMFWINVVAILMLTCAGCGAKSEATSAVGDADQSAIDAYNAAQKADQEAMDASLGGETAAGKK